MPQQKVLRFLKFVHRDYFFFIKDPIFLGDFPINKIFDVPSDPKFIAVCEAKRKALRKYQQLFDTSKIWFASLAVSSLSRYPKRNEAMFGFHSEGLCPTWI